MQLPAESNQGAITNCPKCWQVDGGTATGTAQALDCPASESSSTAHRRCPDNAKGDMTQGATAFSSGKSLQRQPTIAKRSSTGVKVKYRANRLTRIAGTISSGGEPVCRDVLSEVLGEFVPKQETPETSFHNRTNEPAREKRGLTRNAEPRRTASDYVTVTKSSAPAADIPTVAQNHVVRRARSVASMPNRRTQSGLPCQREGHG